MFTFVSKSWNVYILYQWLNKESDTLLLGSIKFSAAQYLQNKGRTPPLAVKTTSLEVERLVLKRQWEDPGRLLPQGNNRKQSKALKVQPWCTNKCINVYLRKTMLKTADQVVLFSEPNGHHLQEFSCLLSKDSTQGLTVDPPSGKEKVTRP